MIAMRTKAAVIMTIFFLFAFFNGCAREEFTDLYGFTEEFGYSEISPSDFYAEKNEDGNNVFYTYFHEETASVMLKLICTKKNKIDEIRIYLPKYDENARVRQTDTQEISLFIRIISSAAGAFTDWNDNEITDILDEMRLYDKASYTEEGELTKAKGSFYFIYHSATLGSEFMIYNTYLKEIPETEKPESRPVYGDTTKIRTETVPTK